MKVIEQIVRLTVDGDETKAEVVGEIVRCKDCKRFKPFSPETIRMCGFTNDGICNNWSNNPFLDDDDFCSKGERKDGETDA